MARTDTPNYDHPITFRQSEQLVEPFFYKQTIIRVLDGNNFFLIIKLVWKQKKKKKKMKVGCNAVIMDNDNWNS